MSKTRMLNRPGGQIAYDDVEADGTGPRPPDHNEYVALLAANLAESGRFASFRSMAPNSHAESGERLNQVTQPGLVIMGTADPDFAEARYLDNKFGSQPPLVAGSGHYPQADNPQAIAPTIVEFVRNAYA